MNLISYISILNSVKKLRILLNEINNWLLNIKANTSDLLLPGRLDNWAERKDMNQWQLTEASVKTHIKAGGRITELQRILHDRGLHRLPPIIDVALSNWTGRPRKTEFGSMIVVRCPNEHAALALRQSTHLKPYYRGSSESTVLFFDAAHEDEVRAFLSWAGFKLDMLTAA